MTLNELKKEVLSLTFENELDSHEAFVFAANRALVEIYSEKERLETRKIHKACIIPNERYEKLTHYGKQKLDVTLSGRAFSFTAVGTGTLLFQDGLSKETINFSGTNCEIKRKINTGTAILSFSGSLGFDIHNLTSFPSPLGESDEDVPVYSSFVKYDMQKIDPLFLSFFSSITDANGQSIQCLKTVGSAIFVPWDYEGEMNVSYRRLPRKIGIDELDTKIDVSEECSHLLALRCAAYLLLDGNEGLAEYYLSLYKSGIALLKASKGSASSEKFLDVLGWA